MSRSLGRVVLRSTGRGAICRCPRCAVSMEDRTRSRFAME